MSRKVRVPYCFGLGITHNFTYALMRKANVATNLSKNSRLYSGSKRSI